MSVATSESGRQARWNRMSLVLMAFGVVALAAAGVLIVLALTGKIGDSKYSGPGTVTGFNVGTVTPQPTPTAKPPPPSEGPISRFVIPKYEIDAPVVERGLDAAGVMIAPDGPVEVAWYGFTDDPGRGPAYQEEGEPCCNAVFSGHVDYVNYGPAVFYRIKDLEQGDGVEVHMADGAVYRYRVISKEQIFVDAANVGEIVGNTPNEIITLITCGGTFNYSTHQYDQRVIVRAERVYDAAPVAPASASTT